METLGLIALILVVLVIIALVSLYVIYFYDRGNLIETGIAWNIVNSGLTSNVTSEPLTISGTDLYLTPNDLPALSSGNYTVTVEVKPNIGSILGRPFLIVNPSNVPLTLNYNNTINSWTTIGGSVVSSDIVQPHSSSQYVFTSYNSNNNQYRVNQVF